jgi:hypothetical protein
MSQQKRVFEPYQFWTNSFCQNTGFFAHLQALFGFADWTEFPSTSRLNELLPKDCKTQSGQLVNFVPQDDSFDFAGRAYESIIYQSGTIPTRPSSWHDLFGAMIWCLFPKTKALLNQLHHQSIESFGVKTRTKTRNAITLLDECGVVMAVSDLELITQLREHQWHEAFVKKRESWGKTITPFMFGHANYEMLTKPYIGLTGKILFVTVEPVFFELSLSAQYQQLDQQLTELISKQQLLADNRYLSPLPLLGVPGWYRANHDVAFYDNKQYFRDKRAER